MYVYGTVCVCVCSYVLLVVYIHYECHAEYVSQFINWGLESSSQM